MVDGFHIVSDLPHEVDRPLVAELSLTWSIEAPYRDGRVLRSNGHPRVAKRRQALGDGCNRRQVRFTGDCASPRSDNRDGGGTVMHLRAGRGLLE